MPENVAKRRHELLVDQYMAEAEENLEKKSFVKKRGCVDLPGCVIFLLFLVVMLAIWVVSIRIVDSASLTHYA